MSADLAIIPRDELVSIMREAIAQALAEHAGAQAASALLDRRGLAQALGVSLPIVDRLRAEGCPELRVGDAPRFELAAVLGWLRARRGGGR